MKRVLFSPHLFTDCCFFAGQPASLLVLILDLLARPEISREITTVEPL